MEIVNQTNYHIAWITGKKDYPADSLTLCVKASFQLVSDSTVLPADPQMLNGDMFVDDDIYKGLQYDSDFAYFKPNADLLLKGTCYTPGGKAVTKCDVRFGVAGVEKKLSVFGSRYATPGLMGDSGSTAEPFISMPISFEKSYGGLGYQKNPVGMGRDKDESGVAWWPNVVDPAAGEKEPASFGPINRIWPQRNAKLGSYGGDYVEKRWPWFPEDFDWAYFNAASEDMQYDGYLNGDEKLFFENLHPTISQYHSQLAGVKPRCFLQEHEGGDDFREVVMNLDTLYVDMDSEQLVLVWRGVENIKSQDFHELSHVYLASEPITQPVSVDDHQANFEAIITPVVIEPVVEEEETAATEAETEPETESPAESDNDIPATEKILEDARSALRQAGQDPAIIDDIVNGADPAIIMATIMSNLGLDPEQGKVALDQAQAQNKQILQEQGLSDDDISMLFGDR